MIIFTVALSLSCDFRFILRDIYYSDVPFFGNQGVVDSIVDNLACMLRVPRYCLHVVSFSQRKTILQLYGAFCVLFGSRLFNHLLLSNTYDNYNLAPSGKFRCLFVIETPGEVRNQLRHVYRVKSSFNSY